MSHCVVHFAARTHTHATATTTTATDGSEESAMRKDEETGSKRGGLFDSDDESELPGSDDIHIDEYNQLFDDNADGDIIAKEVCVHAVVEGVLFSCVCISVSLLLVKTNYLIRSAVAIFHTPHLHVHSHTSLCRPWRNWQTGYRMFPVVCSRSAGRLLTLPARESTTGNDL